MLQIRERLVGTRGFQLPPSAPTRNRFARLAAAGRAGSCLKMLSEGRSAGVLWRQHDAFLVDLDGVVYVGDQPVEHAVAVLNGIASQGGAIFYATNNASHTAEEVATRLRGFGLHASPDMVLTSSDACADFLEREFSVDTTIRIVGADGIRARVSSRGYRTLLGDDGAEVFADVVIQGHSTTTSWRDLTAGFRSIQAGAVWIATNLDLTIPLPGGLAPGNGAMVAALAAALERQPDVVIGKPFEPMFASFKARCIARNPLVIGDRRDTDIAWAHRIGCASLQVDTGVDRIHDAPTRPELSPTYVASDLRGLLQPPVSGPSYFPPSERRLQSRC